MTTIMIEALVLESFEDPEMVDKFLIEVQKLGVTIHGDLTELTQSERKQFAIELWQKLYDVSDEKILGKNDMGYLH